MSNKFPSANIHECKEKDPMIVRTSMDHMSIGSNPAGVPKEWRSEMNISSPKK